MATGEGHGTTLTFAGFTMNLVSVDGPSIERGTIDTSHLSTANNYRTSIPTTLTDGGTLDVTVQYDAEQAPPVTGAAGTLTVDYAGAGVGWSASCFMTTFNPTASLDELMTATAGFKIAGEITFDTTPTP